MDTVSSLTTLKIMKAVDDYYDETVGSKTEVVCRVGNLAAAVVSPIFGAVDFAIGTVGVGLSLGTFGLVPQFNKWAQCFTSNGALGLHKDFYSRVVGIVSPNDAIQRIPNNFIHDTLETISSFAKSLRESDNFFVKHVCSRIVYLGYAVAATIGTIAALAIGIIGAIFYCVTLGFMSGNENVKSYLWTGSKIMTFLHYGLMKMLNPWATIS